MSAALAHLEFAPHYKKTLLGFLQYMLKAMPEDPAEQRQTMLEQDDEETDNQGRLRHERVAVWRERIQPNFASQPTFADCEISIQHDICRPTSAYRHAEAVLTLHLPTQLVGPRQHAQYSGEFPLERKLEHLLFQLARRANLREKPHDGVAPGHYGTIHTSFFDSRRVAGASASLEFNTADLINIQNALGEMIRETESAVVAEKKDSVLERIAASGTSPSQVIR